MRTLVTVMAMVISIYGCQQPQPNDPAGKYYRHWRNEFSVADDTLFCRAVPGQKLTYRIEKHTGYRPMRGGQPQGNKHSILRWTANWDRDKHLLTEGPLGRVLYLTGDSLFLGAAGYKKLPKSILIIY